MKKYVKPELFYERFELSQHIADCAWELTNSTKETCFAVPDNDYIPIEGNLFASQNNGCTWIASEFGGPYTEYCYQGSTEGANVFTS